MQPATTYRSSSGLIRGLAAAIVPAVFAWGAIIKLVSHIV